MLYVDSSGRLYGGDMVPGDRPATSGEAQAHAAERSVIQMQAKVAPVKALREAAINRINGIADREQRSGNATIRAVGDDVVLALLAMTKDLPADPAQVDSVITARYAVIVAPLFQSAPELLSAFAEMDQ